MTGASFRIPTRFGRSVSAGSKRRYGSLSEYTERRISFAEGHLNGLVAFLLLMMIGGKSEFAKQGCMDERGTRGI